MVFINDTVGIKDKNLEINHNGMAIFRDIKIANSNNIQEYFYWEIPNLPLNLKDREVIRIFRPTEEVEKAVDKFSFLPVTDGHPYDGVNNKNIREYIVGFSSEKCEFKDEHIVANSILLFDSDKIIEATTNDLELSCGYSAEIVFEAGVTGDGEVYDGYMKDYVGNHIAIVSKGRCGGTCKL